MLGKTLTIRDSLTVDDLASSIANQWMLWNSLRQDKIRQWEEVRKYKYAVDTSTTSNNILPWKNKTTFPKLTQIADNLWSNYMRSLFPKRAWLIWEGFDEKSEDVIKKDAIENYMKNVIEQGDFKKVMGDCLNDWIDTGNCFVMPEWIDERVQLDDKMQVGFVGPKAIRINPLDIVFNPIAPDFKSTPKIVRKWVTIGDLKEEISRLSASEEEAQALWSYLSEIRGNPSSGTGDFTNEDEYFRVDGFGSFRQYLDSDYAEVLTFYGDMFIRDTGEFLKNYQITIVDRHKLIGKRPNPSFFGYPPIFNCAWRSRADNLWGMGPLDNIVGLQYRIDHLENLKADVMDLNAFPPLKIKGYVGNFTWAPMAHIIVDPGEGSDVEMMPPHWEILNANTEIDGLQMKMEEVVGAPKEAMGIRTPGEKTAYEIQRLESAAGRIFQTRIEQYEDMEEKLLSSMLELGRRKVTSQQLRIYDDELKVAVFQTLTADDITGNGRLRPVAAKHFAERAERVQNATNFFNSQVGMDELVKVHFSGLEMAKAFEDMLDLQGYKLVTPFVRVSEQQEAQALMQSGQEQNMMEMQTPTGLTPEDVSPDVMSELAQNSRNA